MYGGDVGRQAKREVQQFNHEMFVVWVRKKKTKILSRTFGHSKDAFNRSNVTGKPFIIL